MSVSSIQRIRVRDNFVDGVQMASILTRDLHGLAVSCQPRWKSLTPAVSSRQLTRTGPTLQHRNTFTSPMQTPQPQVLVS